MTKDLAIISMACRFPDALNVTQFWHNLIEGKSNPTLIPNDRWNPEPFYNPTPGTVGKTATKLGFFLEDIKSFDPHFFKLKEEDIYVMDPQQRMMIELAYETLKSTQYELSDFVAKKVGVFLGITKSDYHDQVQDAIENGLLTQKTGIIGVLENLIAARISNLFNLNGPSLILDTACSSALVALHTARESILAGSCEMALVGGINLNITAGPYLGMSSAGALSPLDTYYVFDKRAQGFFMGEGGGLILLKELAQAVKDKDHILGVLKSSAINNDGRSISPMAPRSQTQQDVILDAFNKSNISPAQITFIETHGTGTSIGDAIEAQTLRHIFKSVENKPLLSSVKPNVGHLLSAAGIASIIKVLLCFKHRQIPPLANYSQPRLELRLEENGFKLNTALETIETNQPMVAGLNSFGFGGTNAHVILEEYTQHHQLEFKPFSPNYNKRIFWIEANPQNARTLTPPRTIFKPDWRLSPLKNETRTEGHYYILNTPLMTPFITQLSQQLQAHSISHTLLNSIQDINSSNHPAHLIILTTSYQKLFEALKALESQSSTIKKLFLVTHDGRVTKDTTSHHANRWLTAGLAFAAISEFSNYQVQHIDLSLTEALVTRVQYVLKECLASQYDPQIIWRNQERRILNYTPIKATSPEYIPPQNGTFLITGGAQGIGALIAKTMAHQHQLKLILVGRRKESDIPQLKALKQSILNTKSEVVYFSADISKEDEVKQLFNFIKSTYGALTGILHAAGIVSPGRFKNLTLPDFEKVLAPKVKGTHLLMNETKTQGFKPDVFVLFSSMSSLLPGFAKAITDYACANYYLDQWAHFYKSSFPVQVINWGPWNEEGMSKNPLIIQQLQQRGIDGFDSVEGVSLFYWMLQYRIEQGVIINTHHDLKSLSQSNTHLPSMTRPVQHKPSTNLQFTLKELEDKLIELVQEALDEIGVSHTVQLEDNLLDLGLDSLLAIELTNHIQNLGFKNLPIELLFEQQSIKELANYLSQQFQPQEKSQETMDTPQPLSPLQRSFYLGEHLTNKVNFSFVRMSFKQSLDLEKLNQSVLLVLQKHPILRANIFKELVKEELKLFQVIQPMNKFESRNLLDQLVMTDSLNQVEYSYRNQAFHLEEDCLLRIGVVSDDVQTHVLHLVHHIVFDGVSMQVLLKDLWTFYDLLLQNKSPSLKPERIYLKYIEYLNSLNNHEENNSSIEWWSKKIMPQHGLNQSEAIAKLQKQLNQSTQKNSFSVTYQVKSALSEKLKALSQESKIPLQMLFLCAYFQTLSHQFDCKKLLLNCATAGRQYPLEGIWDSIGCYADLFPIMAEVLPETNPIDLAKNLRIQWNQSKAHQKMMSTALKPLLENIPTPFGFSFVHFDQEWFKSLKSLSLQAINISGYQSQTGLAIQISEGLSGFFFSFNMPDKLWPDAKLDALAQGLLKQLEELVNPQINEANIEPTGIDEDWYKKDQPISEAEQNLALEFLQLHAPAQALNHVQTSFSISPVPSNAPEESQTSTLSKPLNLLKTSSIKTIIQNGREYPNQIALVQDNDSLTYHELLEAVLQKAEALKVNRIGPKTVVGVIGKASKSTLITILALMYRGATWVPIESDYPEERIQYMLEASQAKFVVLTETEINSGHHQCKVLLFQDLIQPIPEQSAPQNVFPGDLAYIIFTSGSSGPSKAVPITYIAMEYYLKWAHETFEYKKYDRFILTASIAFDASIRQLLSPLIAGGCLYIPPPECKYNSGALLKFLKEHEITIWSSVPSLWYQLILAVQKSSNPKLPDLRLVQVGGEKLSADWVRAWQKIYRLPIYNLYGPTEATINATFHKISKPISEEVVDIPIGKLLPHFEYLISLNTSDDGKDIGELWLSGPTLTPGYLNAQALNEEKFDLWIDDKRYYKTGDLVSKNKDGLLIYKGRTDRQIKVRGFRVQPEEIERILEPLVTNSHVMYIESDKNLVAFVESKTSTEDELREHLSLKLPGYFIPNQIHIRDSFPLLSNGKTDIKALKESLLSTTNNLEMPEETFLLVKKLWEKLLKRDDLTPESDFFKSGGDSLKLMELFLHLETHFEHLPRIADFYRSRTLISLVEGIESYTGTSMITPLEHLERIPLTSTQKGFYLVHQFLEHDQSSWMAQFFLKGELNIALFKQALQIQLERHMMLQLQLQQDKEPYFKVLDSHDSLALKVVDLTTSQIDQQEIDERVQQEITQLKKQSFDIFEWPLLKMTLIKVANDEAYWLIQAHHILADGYSSIKLSQSLIKSYDNLLKKRSEKFTPLPYTYPQYIQYINQHEQAHQQSSLIFWKKIFYQPYQQPLLRDKSQAQNNTFHHHSIQLNLEVRNQLELQARAQSTTPFTLYLSLFYHALVTFTQQSDLVIGIAHHGRDYSIKQLQEVFGCFARSIPLRINTKQLKSIEAILQNSLSHHLEPTELIRVIKPGTKLQTLFGSQFFLSYLDIEEIHEQSLSIDWDRSNTQFTPPHADTDVFLTIKKIKDRLELHFTFNQASFNQDTLKEFLNIFQNKITQLTATSPQTTPQINFQQVRLNREKNGILKAALIGYLPSKSQMSAFGDSQVFKNLLFKDKLALWMEKTRTSMGTTGLIAIPFFAEDIHSSKREEMEKPLLEAIILATDLGAKCISLAGMIPSVTGFGKLLPETSALITTGHSTTVASMVKTILGLIDKFDLKLSKETIAFIGLGSIGQATLLTLMNCLNEPPEHIILCDVPGSQPRLSALKERLQKECGYQGNLSFSISSQEVSPEAYQAKLMISAVSSKHVISIEKLLPGTLVVDDSFPHCFDTAKAIERMKNKQDVLISGGGLLEIPVENRTLYLPMPHQQIQKTIESEILPNTLASCQMESLLIANHSDLPLTRGRVQPEIALQYIQTLKKFNINHADFHLTNFIVPEKVLQSIKLHHS